MELLHNTVRKHSKIFDFDIQRSYKELSRTILCIPRLVFKRMGLQRPKRRPVLVVVPRYTCQNLRGLVFCCLVHPSRSSRKMVSHNYLSVWYILVISS